MQRAQSARPPWAPGREGASPSYKRGHELSRHAERGYDAERAERHCGQREIELPHDAKPSAASALRMVCFDHIALLVGVRNRAPPAGKLGLRYAALCNCRYTAHGSLPGRARQGLVRPGVAKVGAAVKTAVRAALRGWRGILNGGHPPGFAPPCRAFTNLGCVLYMLQPLGGRGGGYIRPALVQFCQAIVTAAIFGFSCGVGHAATLRFPSASWRGPHR
jgi:hypothetical protein